MAQHTILDRAGDVGRLERSGGVSRRDSVQGSGRIATRRDMGLSRRLLLVFAIACGLVAANLYYAQPMLETIARQFHATSATVGQVVTLTQLGFAAGLFLLVPLGDLLDRRRLIALTLLISTAALLAMAVAPTLAVLLIAGLVVGFTSVVAQILVPFAATLANNANRGRVVGFVMSGLLVGILLSRTIAGLISQVAGWRTVYGLAAILIVALIVILWRELPDAPSPARGAGYGQLLGSVFSIVREEPLLRRRAAYGALGFAAFSVLWTSIAFLLARPPYGYNQAGIGLFGLVGVAGAMAAAAAGRWADRGLARTTTGGFIGAALLAWGLIALGRVNLIALIAGILLLDLGAQGIHITNQSEIYRLRPEARSRLTSAYMTTYFIGGAVGSATSAAVYAVAGWLGVAALGAGFILLALLLWLTELGQPRSLPSRPAPTGTVETAEPATPSLASARGEREEARTPQVVGAPSDGATPPAPRASVRASALRFRRARGAFRPARHGYPSDNSPRLQPGASQFNRQPSGSRP